MTYSGTHIPSTLLHKIKATGRRKGDANRMGLDLQLGDIHRQALEYGAGDDRSR